MSVKMDVEVSLSSSICNDYRLLKQNQILLFIVSSLIVIKFDKAEQHHREGPQRRATVADEGQWDSDDGQHADGHADVDEKVDGKDAGDAIAVIADKRISLFFREF